MTVNLGGNVPIASGPTAVRAALLSSTLVFGAAGCVQKTNLSEDSARQEMVRLLMPTRVKIVEPFTRVKSFDNDATPDGIEVLVQAVNSLDNPGLMLVGSVHVELYQHIPASANQKGKRLEHWNVDLTAADQQKKYWNELTQMYEFRLGINPAVLPLAERYVLAVTYNSPLGEHLTDEIVLDRPSGPKPAELKNAGLLPGLQRN